MKKEYKLPENPTEYDWHERNLWLAHNSDDPEVLEQLAYSPYPDVKFAVVANGSTWSKTLYDLTINSPAVRDAAAKAIGRREGSEVWQVL